MRVRIILPVQLPTPNQFMRMNIYAQTKMKKEYRTLLNVVWQPKYQATEKTKRHVRIISYRKKLIADDDNLKFVAKFLTDALVKTGFIYDDSRKYIDHYVSQELDRKNPRTEIVISTSPC